MNKDGKNGCCSKEGGEGKGECKTACCPITGIPFHCFGKVLIGAIVAGIIAFAVDFVIWGKLFNAAVMAPDLAHLWRPMSDPHWHMMPLSDFIFGLCLAVAYKALSPALNWCKGPSICRGMKFGIIISLIPAVAKVYTCYLVQPINSAIVEAMFLDTFFSCMLGAGALGLMEGCCKKKCAEGEGASCGTSGDGKNHCGGKNGCGGKNHCNSKE